MTPKSLMYSMTEPVEPSNNDASTYTVNKKQILAFEMEDIISSIGKFDFKNNYLLFINDIIKQSLSIQREFCYKILDRIQNVFGFKFAESVLIQDKIDVQDCFKLIEFIEFDNVNFLMNIWKNVLIPDKDNIKEIQNVIKYSIVPKIDNLDLKKYSGLIKNFIDDVPSITLIKVLSYMTHRNYDILIRRMIISSSQIFIN